MFVGAQMSLTQPGSPENLHLRSLRRRIDYKYDQLCKRSKENGSSSQRLLRLITLLDTYHDQKLRLLNGAAPTIEVPFLTSSHASWESLEVSPTQHQTSTESTTEPGVGLEGGTRLDLATAGGMLSFQAKEVDELMSVDPELITIKSRFIYKSNSNLCACEFYAFVEFYVFVEFYSCAGQNLRACLPPATRSPACMHGP